MKIKALIDWLFSFFKSVPKGSEEPIHIDPIVDNTVNTESNQIKVYNIAFNEIGVKEQLFGSNPKVEKYHAYATEDNKHGTDDSVPWCASFVCYCLEMAGLKSTNSRSARSYESYGKPTNKPVKGDIVVFWRDSVNSGNGHVSFFHEFDKDGNIRCLGGNQQNSVCIATYDKSRLLGFRTY